MPVTTVVLTRNLRRHVDLERCEVQGDTVRDALEQVFAVSPRLRDYVLDDTGAVRTHMAVLVDGQSVADRTALSDRLPDTHSRILIVQALSGG